MKDVPGGTLSFTVASDTIGGDSAGYNVSLIGNSGGPTAYYWYAQLSRSKVQNNDVWKAHQRAYKKYFARTRKGTMSKGAFEVWSRKMETLRDDALMEYDRAQSEEERQRIVDEVTQKLNKL